MNFSQALSLKDMNSIDFTKVDLVFFKIMDIITDTHDKDSALDILNQIKIEFDGLSTIENILLVHHVYDKLVKYLSIYLQVSGEDAESTYRELSMVENIREEFTKPFLKVN